MRRSWHFLSCASLLAACAAQAPPVSVSLALPLPTATQTAQPIEAHAVTAPTDEGDFSSERGLVHLTAERDGSLAGTYPNGILTCAASFACRWYEGTNEGRATFHRKDDGRLEGTWGNGASVDDGGSWTLVPVPRAGNLDGAWDTNWGVATIKTKPGGIHVDYPDGAMDCTEHDRTLACAWSESAISGNAELTIESHRVMRGRWGMGASNTDGGPWVFVRRP